MSSSVRPAARPGIFLVLAATAASACFDSPVPRCPVECERGFQCDPVTRSCVEAPLPQYARQLPGRGLRLAAVEDELFVASVDVSDGALVVTRIAASNDARIIATPPLERDRRLGLDASASLVAVAWLNAQNHYELAWRTRASDHAVWAFQTLRPPDGDYTGTQDFDIALRAESAVALVFRDTQGRARALLADAPDDVWRLEMVDDGGTTEDGVACPETLREVQPAAGVGYDPSVAARSGQLVTAYYDADCGDLRLARRVSGQWSVTVVDTGDLATDPTRRGLVGRWPSLGFDPAGALTVAYHDVSRGRLMFAQEREGRFATEVVDDGLVIDNFARERNNLVGAFASLAFDADGGVSIGYADTSNADLLLATRDASASDWEVTNLLSRGAVGFHAALVSTSELGRRAASERLVPTGDGASSELVLVTANP